MALTTVPTNARVIDFQKKFYREYIRGNRMAKLMGADEMSPIQINEDLSRKIGEQTTFYLVNRLTQSGRTGYQTLRGYEEAASTRSFRVTVNRTRHAVTHDVLDEQFSAIDLAEAKRGILKDWFQENIRDRIITALGSMSVDGSTHYAYASADETTIKDIWLQNNADRVAFGAYTGGGTDHSADLAQLDVSADSFSSANLAILKDKAKAASPKIRPIKLRDEEEWYVALAPTKLFRQMQTSLATVNQNAWERSKGESNPLFTGGDLIYDGIIIKEVPEIAGLGAVGTLSALVAPVYLLGAQAIAYAVAQRSKLISQMDDYDAIQGAGIQMIDGIAKMYFGAGASDTTTPKQNGVATGYYAYA
jgi:hypothetical protein